MSASQLAVRNGALGSRDWHNVSVHEDGGACSHAEQMVGADKAVVELCEGAGAVGRAADLLAQVPGPQVQAASHSADAGVYSHEEAG